MILKNIGIQYNDKYEIIWVKSQGQVELMVTK